jgi:hypothetical protein
MNTRHITFITFALCINQLWGQPVPPTISTADVQLKLVSELPRTIDEASALQQSSGKLLWTLNDDGLPVLYGLDTLGNLIKTVYLNHVNHGWESLAADSLGNFYVGNFGNNYNKRRDLRIYKIPDPETITDSIIAGETIRYRYADQRAFPPPDPYKNFDMDAFFCWGNSLYLFTKNRTKPFTGYTRIYKLPVEPGDYEISPVDSIFLGQKGTMLNYWVTGADISPDKKTVILLSHDCLWIIRDFTREKLSSGRIYRVALHDFSHKAGFCFVDNTRLYIVDELEMGILGGKLYSLDITKILESIK